MRNIVGARIQTVSNKINFGNVTPILVFCWIAIDSDYRTESRLFVFAKCPVCIYSIRSIVFAENWYIYCDSCISYFFFISPFNSNWFFVWPHRSSQSPLECRDFKVGNHNHESEDIEPMPANARMAKSTATPGQYKSQFLFAFMANTCSGWLNGHSIEIQWRIRWSFFFFENTFRWKIIECECGSQQQQRMCSDGKVRSNSIDE